jgi:starch synthase
MKVLHAAAECFPLIKTGGLADVVGALPAALAEQGVEARVILPAYRGLAAKLAGLRQVQTLAVREQDFHLLEGHCPDLPGKVWLLDCPVLYDRPGDPYHDGDGHPHPDNAWRFGCYAEAVARLALSGIEGWVPDVLHAHDWQAALIPCWLAENAVRPATVLTLHNLAHQGCFGHDAFTALGLPAHWWAVEIGEFWGGFSYLKAGLAMADALTAVSPRYAQEIQTPAFGQGLDDRLRLHAHKLSGILNGIDTAVWNPATDPYLSAPYSAATRAAGKAQNRRALQARMGLPEDPAPLLIGIVSRFADQKGIDAVLAALPALLQRPVQLVVLGAGDKILEAGFSAAAARYPEQLALKLGYDEALAHQIEAGADAFLMPSRFEPCGLNQLYSMRYGTVPLVRGVGGLADTVTDASPQALAAGLATGLVMDHSDAAAVLWAVDRALALHQTPHWAALQEAGMAQDFSWHRAAADYAALYARITLAPMLNGAWLQH